MGLIKPYLSNEYNMEIPLENLGEVCKSYIRSRIRTYQLGERRIIKMKDILKSYHGNPLNLDGPDCIDVKDFWDTYPQIGSRCEEKLGMETCDYLKQKYKKLYAKRKKIIKKKLQYANLPTSSYKGTTGGKNRVPPSNAPSKFQGEADEDYNQRAESQSSNEEDNINEPCDNQFVDVKIFYDKKPAINISSSKKSNEFKGVNLNFGKSFEISSINESSYKRFGLNEEEEAQQKISQEESRKSTTSHDLSQKKESNEVEPINKLFVSVATQVSSQNKLGQNKLIQNNLSQNKLIQLSQSESNQPSQPEPPFCMKSNQINFHEVEEPMTSSSITKDICPISPSASSKTKSNISSRNVSSMRKNHISASFDVCRKAIRNSYKSSRSSQKKVVGPFESIHSNEKPNIKFSKFSDGSEILVRNAFSSMRSLMGRGSHGSKRSCHLNPNESTRSSESNCDKKKKGKNTNSTDPSIKISGGNKSCAGPTCGVPFCGMDEELKEVGANRSLVEKNLIRFYGYKQNFSENRPNSLWRKKQLENNKMFSNNLSFNCFPSQSKFSFSSPSHLNLPSSQSKKFDLVTLRQQQLNKVQTKIKNLEKIKKQIERQERKLMRQSTPKKNLTPIQKSKFQLLKNLKKSRYESFNDNNNKKIYKINFNLKNNYNNDKFNLNISQNNNEKNKKDEDDEVDEDCDDGEDGSVEKNKDSGSDGSKSSHGDGGSYSNDIEDISCDDDYDSGSGRDDDYDGGSSGDDDYDGGSSGDDDYDGGSSGDDDYDNGSSGDNDYIGDYKDNNGANDHKDDDYENNDDNEYDKDYDYDKIGDDDNDEILNTYGDDYNDDIVDDNGKEDKNDNKEGGVPCNINCVRGCIDNFYLDELDRLEKEMKNKKEFLSFQAIEHSKRWREEKKELTESLIKDLLKLEIKNSNFEKKKKINNENKSEYKVNIDKMTNNKKIKSNKIKNNKIINNKNDKIDKNILRKERKRELNGWIQKIKNTSPK